MSLWRRYRLARFKRRYLAAVAQWKRDGCPLIVLPPEPPCPTGHLETVTIPDLLVGHGTVTACAHCHRVLDQQPKETT